ncbi:hypothetical protein AB0I81_00180 [Nonomuraea sp. NPDC050404]|uniref:hypothetical protein n=1 Tax=Nonomuraea sp. NPDC050404 TaxID=3155783 RepID=UPI0033FFE80F
MTAAPPSPLTALLIAGATALLTACSAQVQCGPCGGSGVQLLMEGTVAVQGRTYEVCDRRGMCEKGELPVMRATPAPASPVPVVFVPLPGDATKHSRQTVDAVIRDGAGRIVGRGQATFPEYRPLERKEPCHCHEAQTDLSIKQNA